MPPSPLLFFVSVLLALALAARLSAPTWDRCLPEGSSPHPPHRPAEPLESNGRIFKLTDVLESGSLRLRLGVIDQQLESGGSGMVRVMVAGCLFFLTLTTCTKKTKRSIAGLEATSLRTVSTSSGIPWQTRRTYSWIILSFSWSATALNLYNSDFASVASRAWKVSTLCGHPAWGSTRSSSSLNTTPSPTR